MVLNYFPLDVKKVDEFFNKAGYFNGTKEKEIKLFDLFDYRFCKYVNKFGKICGRKSRIIIENNCCKQHLKNINNKVKKESYYIKKDKNTIFYCISKSKRNNRCKRIVKNNGDLCKYHNNNSELKNIKNLNPLSKFKKIVNIIKIINLLNKATRKKKNEYIFQDDEIDKLRNIDCNYILKKLKYDYVNEGTIKRYKFNNLNLTINNYNQFYENNLDIKGGGSVDLLIKIFNYKFTDSVYFLRTIFDNINIKKTIIHSFPCSKKEKRKKNYKNIPKYNLDNIDIVKDYLINKRKIDSKIIEELINHKKIYSDKNKNCIFTNDDNSYVYIRGVFNIKYIVTNGKPNFIKYKFNNTNNIYFFESIIDALSYRTMYKKDGLYVSINGNTLINKIDKIEEIKNSEYIYCCFDNDVQGRKFDNILLKKIKNKSIKIIKPINKDFNEDLLKQ